MGDWIKVSQGLTSHHGIHIFDDEVIHASKEHGVIATTFTTFAQGRQVEIVKRCEPGREEEDGAKPGR